MALPGGYTQLRYIESTGAQYINTGFNANNNTRVVIDAQATGTSGTLFLFGCREANNSKSFCFFYYQGWSADYETNGQRKTFSNVTYTDRLLVDFNKTNCSVNGASESFSAATFQSPVPLYLFAVNTNGTISGQLSARLYSCKIYDNDTLVRDYVPARSSGGVIGLYDMVSGDFKINAGTGAFTAGPILTGPVKGNGVSIIDATSYGITEGKTIVDGTGYYIRKGKTLIDGVGYDVSFIKTYTITLTNTGHTNYCYVIVNGTKYINSGTVIEVEEDTVVTFSCYSATNTSNIYRVSASGTQTGVKNGMDRINYNYTVNQDISVSLAGKSGRGATIYIYETE